MPGKTRQELGPRRCPVCHKVELRPAVIQNETTLKHHGRSYNVEVADLHVLQCAACGERLFGNEAHEQINRALRQKIGVMQPSEIRKNRKERGLTQTDLAAGVDAALATISRLEQGIVIQSRRFDNALRNFFESHPPNAKSTGNSTDDLAAAKLKQMTDECIGQVLKSIPSESQAAFVSRLAVEGDNLREFLAASVELCASGNSANLRNVTGYLRRMRLGRPKQTSPAK